jgi:thiamine pyrophosphate-dependent acetolactate synthase large subunit-like protein
MNVAEVVGSVVAAAGLDHVFGVVGSGNFHVTNSMVASGARVVAAPHEGGAATMADAYARVSGKLAAVSVHQGCGLTNALTGIAEAAKSRTPLVVLAAEVSEPRSNFYVDQEALARAVGALPMRITSPATAAADAITAAAMARDQRCTVVLNLPLDVQAQPADPPVDLALPPPPTRATPSDDHLAALVRALRNAERPVFIAGRGSRGSRDALAQLAEQCGAVLATSAVVKGLFHDDPFSLDVSGGFASPCAAELISSADLIVGWGCALNMWTMRHGRLIAAGAIIVQVDDTPTAIGAHRAVTFGVLGDVHETAVAAHDQLAVTPAVTRLRTEANRERIAAEASWRDVPYVDESADGRIDPRSLTIALDDMLPIERIVSVDSGNFMGYPSMFLSVPDEEGFCFTQAFQSIGLGLATAIGAALARPDRLPVAALGDGGALMAAAELDTVVRLGLPMVIVVYNDDAYGAEVHHFGPDGYDLSTVTFPPTDVAAIARGHGFTAATVTSVADLSVAEHWLAGDRDTPLLLDAKVTRDAGAWWLEEAFRGH